MRIQLIGMPFVILRLHCIGHEFDCDILPTDDSMGMEPIRTNVRTIWLSLTVRHGKSPFLIVSFPIKHGDFP